MNKLILNILILFSLTAIVKTQDTIDFKKFDSLKTSSEDEHKIKNKEKGHLVNSTKKDTCGIDVELFRSINNSRTKFKDDIMPLFDRSAPPMALLMPLSTMVYGRFSENFYDENSGYLLGVSEGLNLFLTFGLKYIIKRKRPYEALQNVYHREDVHTDPYSFPSGHTSITFAMATMFNLRYPKYPQVYVPMYVYSLIIAYGRPYFGMHYPSDLLGGAIIGAGSSVLVFSLRTHLFDIKNNILSEDMEDVGSVDGKTIAIFGGAFIASSILGQILLGNNDKIMVSVSPYGLRNKSLNLNLKVSF